MVHTVGTFEAGEGDPLTQRTLPVFFEVLRVLLENGVTVVAEAAFQNWVWRPNLAPLLPLCDLRVVQCHADPDAVRNRFTERGSRDAHPDDVWLIDWERRVQRVRAPEAPCAVDRRRHDRWLPPAALGRCRVRQLTRRVSGGRRRSRGPAG